jgi:hypothetical protein
MQYLFLIYAAPGAGPADGSASQADEMGAYFAFTQEVIQAGAMRGGAPLQGTETATAVRLRGGERLVTDGPFAETAEVLNGFYLLECADLDAALAYAEKIPTVAYGTIEVRPIREIPGM